MYLSLCFTWCVAQTQLSLITTHLYYAGRKRSAPQGEVTRYSAWLLFFPGKRGKKLSSEDAEELSPASERIIDVPPAELSAHTARAFTDLGPKGNLGEIPTWTWTARKDKEVQGRLRWTNEKKKKRKEVTYIVMLSNGNTVKLFLVFWSYNVLNFPLASWGCEKICSPQTKAT